MKKRAIAILLAFMFMMSSLTALAYTQQEKTADALNELDLFRGTGNGYELEKNLTRAEGATLLVRVLGKEEAARNWPLGNIPFRDVPAWAIGYVGYAAANGITNGTGATTFSPNDRLSDYMFLTLVLRALGYTDQGANASFVWNNPYMLAKNVGLIDKAAADSNFTRGDAVLILWNAMSIRLVGRSVTLAESLIAEGVFTGNAYTEAIDIQKNGRKENSGTPILRPENSNTNTNTGTGAGSTNTGSGNANTGTGTTPPAQEDKSPMPWHNGGKQPNEYTWAEYEALDDQFKDAFFEYFGSADAFLAWKDSVWQEEIEEGLDLPWNNGGKQPSAYTWKEFQALTAAQQMAFQNSFGSDTAFKAWMDAAAGSNKWNDSRLPTSYTWAEFQALSAAQQMAFQNWFGSSSAFEAWMEEARGGNADSGWTGSKLPSEYSWAEFQALSAAEQMAFQSWFGISSAFEAWMEDARGGNADNGWSDSKLPSEYTWEEFLDLSGAEQMAFQNWFDSDAAFEEWMLNAMNE